MIVNEQPAENIQTSLSQTLKSHKSVEAYCPDCKKLVQTEFKTSYSKCAHITCAILAVMCCVLGCCLLPYFSMCFVTTKHYCPECGLHLGSYNSCLEFLH